MTGGGKVTAGPLEFHLGLVTDSKGRACSDEAYITVGSDHGQEPTDHEINIHGPRANEIAALIAEAGTVYSETGLTPRQLADEREMLRDKLGIIARCLAPGSRTFDELMRDAMLCCDIARAALAKATGEPQP